MVAESHSTNKPPELAGNTFFVQQLLPENAHYSAQIAFGFGDRRIAMRTKASAATTKWSPWDYFVPKSYIDSKLGSCDLLSEWSYEELQNNSIKNADWSSYNLLLLETGTYFNFESSLIVPVSYFSRTNSSTRPMLYYKTSILQIYKDSETKIAVIPYGVLNNQMLRVYGLLTKKRPDGT